jgi:hypothetical protein
MLRRFELYTLSSNVDPQAHAAMKSSILRSGEHIPDLLHSALGQNLSAAPLDVVWEHAFDSPAAYQRYMVHPYHAAVLDRFLLKDSPECVVTHSALSDAGLIGYSCEGAPYRMQKGFRRVTLLGVEPSAPPEAVAVLEQTLSRSIERTPGMTACAVARNTMGARWFDGITPITDESRWTHIWEQGFDTLTDLEAYRQSRSPEAKADRDGWAGWMDGIVKHSAELYYQIHPGDERLSHAPGHSLR